MRRLDEEPDTELIVVVSKPPAKEVAQELQKYAESLSPAVEFAVLADGQPDRTQAAEKIVAALGREAGQWPVWGEASGGRGGRLRGLFAGGTLCDESTLLAQSVLGPVWSNIPLNEDLRLDSTLDAGGTVM